MNKNLMKATFITIVKKNEFTSILVREDKNVWMNFGDDNWFNFSELRNIKILDRKKKYKTWLESDKFKKNWIETNNIIKNNDYDTIVDKFIKDFKRDRNNKIVRNDVELDTGAKINDIKYEFKR